ncbi:hypothetical protein CR513_43551, partial [Mucuna pruriens]
MFKILHELSRQNIFNLKSKFIHDPTQNVFDACDFDMKFTYILVRREGISFDSGILRDTLIREDPLIIIEGQYVVCQGSIILGMLTSCLNIKFLHHIEEYLIRGPQNYRELFNLDHSSL